MTASSEPAGATGAPPTVVWLHGVGGPPRGPGWRLLLDRELRAQGFAGVRRSEAAVVDYRAVLLGAPEATARTVPAGRGPPVPRETSDARAAARPTYRRRRRELRDALQPHRVDQASSRLGDLPPGVRRRLVDAVSRTPWNGFPEVRFYLDRPRRRRRVIATTLAQLPPGPLVVVAHSLGSVVAVDLLDRLEPGRLQLLLTVGSPLGLDGLSDRQVSSVTPFPYDKVGAWVNLRTPWDWITGGVPLDRRIPAVIDVPVATPAPARQHHWRSTYLTLPATAAAIGRARAWR